MSTLKQKYQTEVVEALKKEYDYKNVHEIPKIDKVVVNVGAGEAVQNVKCIENIVGYIKDITGQKPIIRKAKKSIAGFKLREGHPIGVKVTLRRDRMYDFLERLFSTVLPRVRDFKGVSRKAFDGAGNYSLGIKEQLVFPEVSFDKIDKVRGLNITIVTTAKTDDDSRTMLQSLGMPFRKK